MQQNETWIDVPQFEQSYQVSNLGRVRSKDRTIKKKNRWGFECDFAIKGKMLSQVKVDDKYLVVTLLKNGHASQLKVHRIVAMAFITNPNGYKEVNHKDENKLNNEVSNLEWCDRKYNANYGTAVERMRAKTRNRKDTSKPVYQYTLDGELVNVFPSCNEAQRCTGVDHASIARCCHKRTKSAGGFTWNFKE
jgi:hypothetical protein